MPVVRGTCVAETGSETNEKNCVVNVWSMVWKAALRSREREREREKKKKKSGTLILFVIVDRIREVNELREVH